MAGAAQGTVGGSVAFRSPARGLATRSDEIAGAANYNRVVRFCIGRCFGIVSPFPDLARNFLRNSLRSIALHP